MNGPLDQAATFRQLGFLTDFMSLADKADELRAAVLVGSLADGTGDELSDVDLILVTSDEDSFRGRQAWRSLIPGRILYSSECSGSPGGRIQLFTGALVSVELTLCTRDRMPCLLSPYRVLFDKDRTGWRKVTGGGGHTARAGSDVAGDLPLALLAIARRYMRGETERALSELSALASEATQGIGG